MRSGGSGAAYEGRTENKEKRGELRPITVWIPVEKADPTDHDDNEGREVWGSMAANWFITGDPSGHGQMVSATRRLEPTEIILRKLTLSR